MGGWPLHSLLFQFERPIVGGHSFQHGGLCLQERIVNFPKAAEELLPSLLSTAFILDVKS
jgi:hypothetical protein